MLSNAPATCSGGPSTAGTKQFMAAMQTNSTSNWGTTYAQRSTMCGAAFTCLGVYIELTNAPGVGTTWTFTLQQNGSDTAITGTISDNATTVFLAGSVAFSAGDTIALAGQATLGTPASTGAFRFALLNSASGVFPIFGGCTLTMSASATNYNSPLGLSSESWSATETDYSILIPCDGTIDNLYAVLDGAAGSGKSYDLTLVKNGTPTTLTVNLPNDTSVHSDTTHSFHVSAGDLLSMKDVPNGTPTVRRARWGWRFTPDTDGQFFMAFGNPATPSTSVNTVESGLGVGVNLWQTTTTNHHMIMSSSFLAKKLYVSLSAAPGTGKSYDFHAALGGADSVLHKLISDAATSGNAAVDLAFGQGDYLYLKAKPAATPASAAVKAGILFQPAVSGDTSSMLIAFA